MLAQNRKALLQNENSNVAYFFDQFLCSSDTIYSVSHWWLYHSFS